MRTMLFNPYTGKPRHPLDIASDPAGVLMLDPDEPVRAVRAAQAQPSRRLHICHQCGGDFHGGDEARRCSPCAEARFQPSGGDDA